MMRLCLALLIICWISDGILASETRIKSYRISKSNTALRIDGSLNDEGWKLAEIGSDFKQTFPFDSSNSVSETLFKLCYDANFLYVAVICHNRDSSHSYVSQTLRRDFDEKLNDAIQLVLDPFNDQYNGFSFMVSPYNVQSEGLITGGGTYGQTNNWDNRWYSAVERTPKGWTAELAIPFKSIRFNPNLTTWGINLARIDLKNNEISCWNPIPRTFSLSSLAFTGKLFWDEPAPHAGLNYSIIPYGIAEINQNQENQEDVKQRLAVGGDAKIAVSSSLNLDITINPDFSQADVDRQVTNLTRFSLFFPERRQFFLENSDLFGQFGFSKIRPFFSRRIGLLNGQRVPIQFGARLSGKLDQNWRIGFMNVQTGGIGDEVVPENFTVACFQRQVNGRSNIGGIFVNRQETDKTGFASTRFNRIAGLDYKLASRDGRWNGIAFFHKSFNPGGSRAEDYAHASFLRYDDANWSLMWNHEYVGKNYEANAGFVPRREQFDGANNVVVPMTYWRLEPEISYRQYLNSKGINRIEYGLYASLYADSILHHTEQNFNANIQVNYTNSSYIGVNYTLNRIRLIFPFDVTFTGLKALPASSYIFNEYSIYGRTDVRRKVNASGIISTGGFYTGTKQSVSGILQFRLPPYAILGINYSRDAIALGSDFGNTVLNLIGPSLDISMSKSLFFSSVVQYNDQSSNMNLFARLQWRFKPMSDAFLVFTNNYLTPIITPRNWALIAKVSIWITP
jgi:hypothetical protein